MIDDYFFDEHAGKILFVGFILLALFLGWVLRREHKREQAACGRAWVIAQTPADSLAVMRMCELKDRHIQPVPIIIPVR
jgi:hypothetical protein